MNYDAKVNGNDHDFWVTTKPVATYNNDRTVHV